MVVSRHTRVTITSAAVIALGMLTLSGVACRQRARPSIGLAPAVAVASSKVPQRPIDHARSDSVDLVRFTEIAARFAREGPRQAPLGEAMQFVGEGLVGAAYVGGLLDRGDSEELVISFTEFDCVLFVETTLALARGFLQGDMSFEGFARRLEEQRYRDGVRDGYCSRLHYFSEWIANNAERGILRNITAELGGEKLNKRLNFMSEHRTLYPRFAANDSLFAGIVAMEQAVRHLDLVHIPQARIADVAHLLKAGDIVATTTDIAGLDVSHSGLVYKSNDGQTGFLHASISGTVKIAPDLAAYVNSNAKQIGIVIARPLSGFDDE